MPTDKEPKIGTVQVRLTAQGVKTFGRVYRNTKVEVTAKPSAVSNEVAANLVKLHPGLIEVK